HVGGLAGVVPALEYVHEGRTVRGRLLGEHRVEVELRLVQVRHVPTGDRHGGPAAIALGQDLQVTHEHHGGVRAAFDDVVEHSGDVTAQVLDALIELVSVVVGARAAAGIGDTALG